ncbi:MAG: hypothetical protein D6732_12720 [Methanobacteriota archaeon]|nr:MAG: hypothetical protein D6732_12720 [Euryarchaeota archaeon]
MELIGWIVNIHFRDEYTHLWLKDERREIHHLRLRYHPVFYMDVSGYSRVPFLLSQLRKHSLIRHVEQIHAFVSNESPHPSPVLKIHVRSPNKFERAVKSIGKLRLPLYNTDLHPREKFFQDTGSFPLGKCKIQVDSRGEFKIEMLENPRDPFYEIVPLKVLKISVIPFVPSNQPFPTFDDPIASIDIDLFTSHQFLDVDLNAINPVERVDLTPHTVLEALHIRDDDDIQSYRLNVVPSVVPLFRSYDVWETITPQTNRKLHAFQTMVEAFFPNDYVATADEGQFDESSAIYFLNFIVQHFDPDILIVVDGDSFTLPYLQNRALRLNMQINLGRLHSRIPLNTEAQSYYSYGRIHRKNLPIYIPGRIHIDQRNSHFFSDSGLFGVIELSRLGGIPPDRCARNTIGTVLTSIEFMIAANSSPPILIPKGKAKGEQFKPGEMLLVADNGGITYPAIPGIYADVWGIDFASLYPSIMLKHNISSETVLCECCKEDGLRVPEIDYHVCIRRRGIVPLTMQLILEKRLFYKYLQKSCSNPIIKKRFKGIDESLKWILVSCFGYLGFKNARFGSIESHQAVTAYARKYLRDAQAICRDFGFRTIAGLTDSLFIQATNPKYNSFENIASLIREISLKTGFAINVDGHFKWIVFTNIKNHKEISALNRYYGAYDDGNYKIRGIFSRQHSTPPIAKKLQEEILTRMSRLESPEAIVAQFQDLLDILQEWKERIAKGLVNPRDLVFKMRCGKSPEEYTSNTVQALAAQRYLHFGKRVRAGENMRFIIKNDKSRTIDRVLLADELTSSSPYDRIWYMEYLDRVFLDLMESIIHQFGLQLPPTMKHKLEEPAAISLTSFL